MSELSKRRSGLIKSIQRSERHRYLGRLREQLLLRWKDEKEKTEVQHVLYTAFVSYQQQNGPYLDIYVNIQQLLDEAICTNKTSHFAYQMSLFLYIVLTSSDEVITYMVYKNAIRQWEKMRFLAKTHSKCEEYLYERMSIFLQIICAKYNIEPFHAQQFHQNELKKIFNQEFTNQFISKSFFFDQDSEHSGFIETYLSLVPPSHLYSLLISQFAGQVISCKNTNISLVLLGKIQSAKTISTQFYELYEKITHIIMENGQIQVEYI